MGEINNAGQAKTPEFQRGEHDMSPELAQAALRDEVTVASGEAELPKVGPELNPEDIGILLDHIQTIHKIQRVAPQPRVDAEVTSRYTASINHKNSPQRGKDMYAIHSMLLAGMQSGHDAMGMFRHSGPEISALLDDNIEVGARLQQLIQRVLQQREHGDTVGSHRQLHLAAEIEVERGDTNVASLIAAFEAGSVARYGGERSYSAAVRLIDEIARFANVQS